MSEASAAPPSAGKKWARRGIVTLVIYVLLVAGFETWLGVSQPSGGSTLTLTVTRASGEEHSRVLSTLMSGETLYVAVNHWPRSWYRQAMARPEVTVERGGTVAPYTAVRVEGEERDRIDSEQPLPLFFKFLTGFPPRHIIRLDPALRRPTGLRGARSSPR